MTTNSASIKVAPDCVVHVLQHEAVEYLKRGEEVVLDFSSVHRIDPSMAKGLEELAALADQSSLRVILRAVNTDIYKVLKLLRLSQRFSFLS